MHAGSRAVLRVLARRFPTSAGAVRPANVGNRRAVILHASLHVVMAGVMAATMVGTHSIVRTLLGAGLLLLLAMVLARFVRSDRAVAGHVIDCFAMAVGLVVAMSGPVDVTAEPHAHAATLAVPGLVALTGVAAAWTIARVALLVASRPSRSMSLAGAGLTAAGFVAMFAMT